MLLGHSDSWHVLQNDFVLHNSSDKAWRELDQDIECLVDSCLNCLMLLGTCLFLVKRFLPW